MQLCNKLGLLSSERKGAVRNYLAVKSGNTVISTVLVLLHVTVNTKAVSYVSDHKRAVRATRANHLLVLRRRTQEASRERSTSVSVVSWKGKRGLLLS
jgi:hypothetical protein